MLTSTPLTAMNFVVVGTSGTVAGTVTLTIVTTGGVTGMSNDAIVVGVWPGDVVVTAGAVLVTGTRVVGVDVDVGVTGFVVVVAVIIVASIVVVTIGFTVVAVAVVAVVVVAVVAVVVVAVVAPVVVDLGAVVVVASTGLVTTVSGAVVVVTAGAVVDALNTVVVEVVAGVVVGGDVVVTTVVVLPSVVVLVGGAEVVTCGAVVVAPAEVVVVRGVVVVVVVVEAHVQFRGAVVVVLQIVVVGAFGVRIFSNTQRTSAPGFRRMRRTCFAIGVVRSASLSFLISTFCALSMGGETSIGPSGVLMLCGWVASGTICSCDVNSSASSG